MKKLNGVEWFLVIMAISFIFIVGCNLKNPVSFESDIYADQSNVIHTIDTTFISDGTNVAIKCTSFHVGNGYILTCTHGIIIKTRVIRTPFGSATIPVNGQDYKYTMDGEPIELLGYVADVALLYNDALIGTPNVVMSNSDHLAVGDKLMIVGNSGMQGINIKVGIVSRLSIPVPILDFPANTAPDSFVLQVPVNPGDSGSPIFVVDEITKNYYVVGMVYAGMPQAQEYNLGIKSNYLLSVMAKVHEVNDLPNIGR